MTGREPCENLGAKKTSQAEEAVSTKGDRRSKGLL